MAQGFNLIMWWCEETHFLFFFSFHFHEALINNIYFFFLLDAFLKVRASRFWVTSFRLLNTCTPFPFCQSNYDLRQWALQAPALITGPALPFGPRDTASCPAERKDKILPHTWTHHSASRGFPKAVPRPARWRVLLKDRCYLAQATECSEDVYFVSSLKKVICRLCSYQNRQ